MIRSIKNAFAPINRTSPDILSLIPDYWSPHNRDSDIVKLTHVCHGWRELFISRPSLWNLLDCVDVDKTRAYLKRSKSLPLKIFLKKDEKGTHYPNDALQLVDPHIRRVWTLIVVADREMYSRISSRTSPIVSRFSKTS